MMNTIINFFNSILQGIPDILFAILLLVVAFVVAKIVKSLVVKLLKAVNAEKFLAKLGVQDTVTKSSIEFVGKLVYFVTFLLFLPGVLDKLGMHSVSTPITNMANSFLAFVPKLVAAAIVVVVGLFIANIVKDLLISLLRAVKVDALQEKAGINATENTSFSSIIANVIYGVIVLIVVTTALDQLGIAAISDPANEIVSSIFAMIPNVLAAIVIIAAGVFIAKLVAKLLESLLAGVGTDSLLEKVSYDKDSSKVFLEIDFCNWKQTWYNESDEETLMISLVFENVSGVIIPVFELNSDEIIEFEFLSGNEIRIVVFNDVDDSYYEIIFNAETVEIIK